MAKSRDAFRTISEVAEWLETPAHVLRFWETKFPQIKPVKRAGGRRYYRPDDMALIGGIKVLLHEQGMTIKGAQKLLRERGVRHVAALGPQPPGAEPALAEASETSVLSLAAASGAAPPPGPREDAPPPRPTLAFTARQDAPAADEAAQISFLNGLVPEGPAPAEAAGPAPEDLHAPADGDDLHSSAQHDDLQTPADPAAQAPVLLRLQSPQDAAPAPEQAAAHRGYAAVYSMDPEAARARAEAIAPLVRRLSALRDRIARDVA